MRQSITEQLRARKRRIRAIFAMAAALLALSQTAQAQQCTTTLNQMQWASPNPSTPLTVFQMLNPGQLTCQTPPYLGLHRAAQTRAMDLNSSNDLAFPLLGAGFYSGYLNAGPTVLYDPSSQQSFPVFPQSIVSVAIPAYQSYLSSSGGHLPTNIDSTGALLVKNAVYPAWPAIIELDPRQDATGTWYLLHGVNTNTEAKTPGVDPNDPNQAPLPTAQATLANDKVLYRAAPLLQGYEDSSLAPNIDQFATAGQILDQIMTDPSVNMVLQLHARSYTEILSFYTWLLQTWAPPHTNAEMTLVIGKIFFCVDLNKIAPPGQGTTTNDYHNLGFLSSWQAAVQQILAQTQSKYPNMPFASFPPLALMVNFYDDTNINTQADVNAAFSILQQSLNFPNVKYMGLEISDESSPLNLQLQSLGQMAKSQLAMQIGKSVSTGDHFVSVTDSNGNAAIKYGTSFAGTPFTLNTSNNAIIDGTSAQQLWANNQANLVDLNYSLSFALGVQDTDPSSSMNLYDPTDNTVTALQQVQPTIVLTDLPLLHGAMQNGEVRSVFQGTYSSPTIPSPIPALPAGSSPALPAGAVVPNVSAINTAGLLSQMNSPNAGLTLVAANRGYWVNWPENSALAIQAAFSAGVEVVKIDLRASSDNHLVVSYDGDLIRETNWTSLHGSQPSFVSQTPWSTIQSLTLLDRKGHPSQDGNGQPLRMLEFANALQILNSYSSERSGPVLIAEIEDTNPTVAWNDYLEGVAFVQSLLPPGTQPAVLFKIPLESLPALGQIQTACAAHPAYGHLVGVGNPGDATSGNWMPGSTNFQSLSNLSCSGQSSFVNQFELNINTVGDGAAKYLSGQGGSLKSFATYNESKFYPEGVSTSYGGPTDTRNFNPKALPPNLQPGQTFCCYQSVLSNDLRGLLPFALFYSQSTHPVSLITTDSISDTLNLLVSLGQRNVSKIQ